eukprot:scaffold26174_cov20-Tisochrysis_lutea.AAC.1
MSDPSDVTQMWSAAPDTARNSDQVVTKVVDCSLKTPAIGLARDDAMILGLKSYTCMCVVWWCVYVWCCVCVCSSLSASASVSSNNFHCMVPLLVDDSLWTQQGPVVWRVAPLAAEVLR